MQRQDDNKPATRPEPGLGLALGGGAARGLAHIVVLEVLDELGVRPAMIAGASMGAMVGAAYAGGMAARDIREHVLQVLGKPAELARRLLGMGSSETSLFSLLNFSISRGVMIDGLALLEAFMPPQVPELLEELPVRMLISATDFYGVEEVVFRSGPVREAVAASIAIPAVIAAPRVNERLLVDGAIVNPVPFDLLQQAGCRPVIAVEVTGRPMPRLKADGSMRKPGMTDLGIGAMQIMQLKLAALKRASSPPELWIDPPLDDYRAYDFLKAREILERADAMRDAIRHHVDRLLEAGETGVVDSPLPPVADAP